MSLDYTYAHIDDDRPSGPSGTRDASQEDDASS